MKNVIKKIAIIILIAETVACITIPVVRALKDAEVMPVVKLRTVKMPEWEIAEELKKPALTVPKPKSETEITGTFSAQAAPKPNPEKTVQDKPAKQKQADPAPSKEDLAIRAALTDVYGWGRLVIPDEGINVPVYASGELNEAQAITDRLDSAVYMTWSPGIMIADHSNQGFDAIKSSVPRQTMAYIGRPDGTVEQYICSDIFQGHNTDNGITDSNYQYIEDDNPGGLITYTCNECWQNVTIVFWQPVN